jgi:hypothetical protein
MVERRGRELRLAARGRRRVFRNHAPQNFELHLAQQELVRFVEPALLAEERQDALVAVQVERVHPGQLVPHLQVQKISVGISPAGVALLQELRVPRVGVESSGRAAREKNSA